VLEAKDPSGNKRIDMERLLKNLLGFWPSLPSGYFWTNPKDDEMAQKRVKDAHRKGGGKAGTGEAMGGPKNDWQETE